MAQPEFKCSDPRAGSKPVSDDELTEALSMLELNQLVAEIEQAFSIPASSTTPPQIPAIQPSTRIYTSPNYSFAPDCLVNFFDVDPVFRSAMVSGKYLYFDHRIILKNSACFTIDSSGSVHLQQPSQGSIDDYCMSREDCYVYDGKEERWLPEEARFHLAKFDDLFTLDEIEVIFEKQCCDVRAGQLELLISTDGGGPGIGLNLSKLLSYHMKRRGLTIEALAERSGVSDKTIQRILRDPDYLPTLKTAIGLCVGLQLDPFNSMTLIHYAGYYLTNAQKHRVYYTVVMTAYNSEIYTINNFLENHNVPPLSTE